MKPSTIEVTPFPFVRNDAGICDVARVSFAKTADQFTEDQNRGLIRYLAKNKHWSPFGHARIVVRANMDDHQKLFFFSNAQLAGFTWANNRRFGITLNGSVWAFFENERWLPSWLVDAVMEHMAKKYPWAADVLFSAGRIEIARINAVKDRGMVRVLDDEEVGRGIENANLLYPSFRVVGPIFLARQAVKHQIHLCWNEESRRYIDEAPSFFEIKQWRGRPAKSVKQGSEGVVELPPDLAARVGCWNAHAAALYADLLAEGVAPELARSVLPLSTQTEWIWTGSLPAWKRICNLRLDPHAQEEARVFAQQVDAYLREEYASCWDRL